MAMGPARTGLETRQIAMVSLEELVPGDDLYRRIEPHLAVAAIRAQAAPYYSERGRPSICPAVLVKLFLVAAIEGLGSMRATLAHAGRDLSVRRFLGYGLGERLPHHATVSFAQCVRFAEAPLFEQLFTAVLARCRDAGLLEGTRLVVDATHVEADAALKSLRAELRALAAAAPEAGAGPPESADAVPGPAGAAPSEPGRPALRLAAPRSGPTPRRRATNATAVSRTDPDAKLRHKPGQRPHLVHRAQVVTDPKARVIVAVAAEPATGHEGTALAGLIGRARFAGHRATELAADSGYASQATYAELARLDCTAFIPPQPGMRHAPLGAAARGRCKSPPGVAAAIDRQAHAEGSIAELKLWHGLGRARCRGTAKLQVQLLVAATAVNLKRLATRAGTDAHPPAPADQQAQAAASLQRLGRVLWTYELCLN